MAEGARIVSHVDQVLRTLEPKVQRGLLRLGANYKTEVQRLMRQSPPTGIVYARSPGGHWYRQPLFNRLTTGKRITHRASSPGQPPRVRDGFLVNSVAVVPEITAKGFSVVIGSSLAVIPSALEFGTARVKARPAWRPALRVLLGDAAAQAFRVEFRGSAA